MGVDMELRFWPKVVGGDVETCWEWTGSRDDDGYGVAFAGKQRRRAHRIAYESLVAEVPAGLLLDHLCRNRGCVNPWHMEPVTNRVNVLRGEGITADNARRTVCANGHPLDGENLGFARRTDGRIRRFCRACQQRNDAAYRARRRSA